MAGLYPRLTFGEFDKSLWTELFSRLIAFINETMVNKQKMYIHNTVNVKVQT